MTEIPLPKCDEADYIMGKAVYEVTTMMEENEMEFIFTTLTRFVNSEDIKDKLMRPLHSVIVPKQLVIDALNTYVMEHPEEALKTIGGE